MPTTKDVAHAAQVTSGLGHRSHTVCVWGELLLIVLGLSEGAVPHHPGLLDLNHACVCRCLLIAEQAEAPSIYALIKYVYSMRNILFELWNGIEDISKQQLPLIEFILK